MKKLLQLLNKYEKVIWTDRVWWWAIDDGAFFCTRKSKKGNLIVQYSSEDEAILQIISKKFWFIQWLYDEQKIIDDNKMSEVNIIELEDKASGIITDYSLTSENVLMLLAISDDPISFLVSVLK